MATAVPDRLRVVEVVADLGPNHSPRWRYGSGLLVGGGWVLTAAHVVARASAVMVRRPDKSLLAATLGNALIGDPDGRVDLAILEVPEAEDLPFVKLALVNRDAPISNFLEGFSVGYPQFQEVRLDNNGSSVRETAHVRGDIPPLSGLASGLLTLQVTASPRELPPADIALGRSEWSGMSGAAVFAKDRSGDGAEFLVGVIGEHSPRRGSSDITVIPLNCLLDPTVAPANAVEWWARLGITQPERLVELPHQLTRPDPAYWATLRMIRNRTVVLLGRETELAQITAFASGADEVFGSAEAAIGYLWLMGGPWAGKTALLAEAVHALPGDVDVVAYFMAAREAQASQEQFLAAVIPQLAWLLGEDIPVVPDVHVFRSFWARCAERADNRNRHLFMVVDGLDEDLRPSGRSVAALLPTEGVGRLSRVMIASRLYPPLPVDVDAYHPLRAAQTVDLPASPYAAEIKIQAEQEIWALLSSRATNSDLAYNVLGLLTAAAGPLTIHDLASITGEEVRNVRMFVTDRAARSLEVIPSTDDDRYQFAHQSLLEFCQAHPDVGDPQYRQRLYAWADIWSGQGWPGRVAGTGTPRYLLDAYPTTLVTGPTDPLWRATAIDRLAGVASNMGWVDSAVSSSGLDSVSATLRTAAEVAPSEHNVNSMLRLVQLQAHNLRPSTSTIRPGFTATHLGWEALRIGLDSLSQAAASHLALCPAPQFIPRWTTSRTSSHLISVIGRHDGAVRSVVVLPDLRIISAGDDRALRLWDPSRSGDHGIELGLHLNAVFAMAILRDGRVISVDSAGVMLIWDPSSPGSPGIELGCHDGEVAVDVLPDGRVVSGGRDGRLRVWDLSRPGHPTAEFGEVQGAVFAVGVLRDGRVISAHGSHGVVRLWDLAGCDLSGCTGCSIELGRHDRRVLSLVVLPNGQVVSASTDGRLRLWDPSVPGEFSSEPGHHQGGLSAVAALPDGRVVSGGGDGRVRLWDPSRPKDASTELGRHRGRVRAVAALPDGRLVSGAGDRVVRLWDPYSPGDSSGDVGVYGDETFAVAVLPNGLVVAGGDDRVVRLWDPSRPNDRGIELGRHRSRVRAVTALPDARVVSGGEDGKVLLWDSTSLSASGIELGRHDGVVFGVAFLPHDRIVSVGGDGRLMLWNLLHPTDPGIELGRYGRRINAVAALPDGRVVSGGGDGMVRLWDPSRPGESDVQLDHHHGPVFVVAVSAVGRVASAGVDGIVRLCDPSRSGRPGMELGRHDSKVRAMTVLPDERVFSGGGDGRIWQWSPTNPGGKGIELFRQDSRVNAMAVVPGSQRIVTSASRLSIFEVTSS